VQKGKDGYRLDDMGIYLKNLKERGVISAYTLFTTGGRSIYNQMFVGNFQRFGGEEYTYIFMGWTLFPDDRKTVINQFKEERKRLEQTTSDSVAIEKGLILFNDKDITINRIRRENVKGKKVDNGNGQITIQNMEHAIAIAKELDGSFWFYDNGKNIRTQVKSIADVVPFVISFWKICRFKLSV
jgi:hypothetical protein